METIASMHGSCLQAMQNLFGRPCPNSFCIVSAHNPYLLTIYLCIFIMFLPYIYSDTKHFEYILVILFNLFILVFKFVVSSIVPFSYSKQTTFSDHKNSFYSVLFNIYTQNILHKNLWMMFEKLYKTHLGNVTQICFVVSQT